MKRIVSLKLVMKAVCVACWIGGANCGGTPGGTRPAKETLPPIAAHQLVRELLWHLAGGERAGQIVGIAGGEDRTEQRDAHARSHLPHRRADAGGDAGALAGRGTDRRVGQLRLHRRAAEPGDQEAGDEHAPIG